MKLALIFLAVLTSLSLWSAPQGTPPVVCRGKPLPVTMLEKPGVEMRVPPIPIRFGGTRYGPIWQLGEKPLRLLIKNRDEFNDFWLIEKKGWTQAQTAERIALDQPKVSRPLRGIAASAHVAV